MEEFSEVTLEATGDLCESFITLLDITYYNFLSWIRAGRGSLRLFFAETERRSVWIR